MGALTNSNLCKLTLSNNRSITARGYKSLAALLESEDCSLRKLLNQNTIRDEGALIFANALANNRKVMELQLCQCSITAEGWSSFSRVLCDTSTVNNTFLSNHTIGFFGHPRPNNLSPDLESSLALNQSSDDKKQVAIKKILKHHRHLDMQPFFEWDL